MRARVRGARGQAGFSLIELVVVVGLVSLVLGMLALGVRRASDAFQLRRAASLVTAELRRAHAAAVSAGAVYTVELVVGSPGGLRVYRRIVEPDGSEQWLLERTVGSGEWPSSVTVDGTDSTVAACTTPGDPSNKCVTFQPLGFAVSGGDVRLVSRSGVGVGVQVTAATGRVSVVP
ncbi:MAG: prepilin-type N-terminal cleavage/methylation domain-containing protein [Armatimonadota bacterium]|nr:prepilin-type N-terminal cleavage/methylation domain-containing protein [Armatimonadota bacterium]